MLIHPSLAELGFNSVQRSRGMAGCVDLANGYRTGFLASMATAETFSVNTNQHHLELYWTPRKTENIPKRVSNGEPFLLKWERAKTHKPMKKPFRWETPRQALHLGQK
jgi:hypothetical protein